MKLIEMVLKPLIDEAYDKGFAAGVNAERLVKEKRDSEHEYDLLRRGAELGREETLRALEAEIDEIDAAEFNRIAAMSEDKPFGFVGTIDDISLVLEEA